jgi:hypothetical protein
MTSRTDRTARTFRVTAPIFPDTAQTRDTEWLREAKLDRLLASEDDAVQDSEDSVYLSSFRYSSDSEPF